MSQNGPQVETNGTAHSNWQRFESAQMTGIAK